MKKVVPGHFYSGVLPRLIRNTTTISVAILGFGFLYAQPGAPDSGFDGRLNGVDLISTVAPQADGKLILGGRYIGEGQPRGCLARLNPNGSFDPSFRVGLGPVGSSISAILVEADGRLLVGGDFTNYNGTPCGSLVRLTSGGTVDTDGSTGTGVDGSLWGILPHNEGKILLTGAFTKVNGVGRTNLARLSADGTLDEAFVPEIEFNLPVHLALQPDNKILVFGEFRKVNGLSRMHLARLNVDGSTDLAFCAPFSQEDWVQAIAVQRDGQILLGGGFFDRIGHSPIVFGGGTHALTLRLNPDGSLDPTFIPVLNNQDTGQCRDGSLWGDEVRALAVQNDGKITIAGSFSLLNGFPARNVARLNSDGTVDGNFEARGGPDGQVSGMIPQADGHMVIHGCFHNYGTTPAPMVARVQGGEPGPSAPTLLKQPTLALFRGGGAVTLTALIAGFPPPVYQWQRDGIDLADATHPELILSDLSPASAGIYQLRVTNSLGTVTSAPLQLLPPTVSLVASTETVMPGQNVSFSAVATNLLPLTLQWQFEGTDIAGKTDPILVLSNIQPAQAGEYTVRVSNAVGSVTSPPLDLTVLPPEPPQILAQPSSQTVEDGFEVLFGVVATNYLTLAYQWQFNSSDIPGATQSVLRLPSVHASDVGGYRVLVSSPFETVESAAARLFIIPVDFVSSPGVVTNLDQANIQVALTHGVPVTFGVNGIIPLIATLVITNDTTFDGTRRSITLDGQNRLRHFVVTNGATLRLINLTLANGRDHGLTGAADENGSPGMGGSIHVSDGTLELIGCRFMGNGAQGGDGGTPTPCLGCVFRETLGASGFGGALYVTNGTLRASHCTFADNRALGGQGRTATIYTVGGTDAYGGAVYSISSVSTLTEVTFTNNVVQGGDLSGWRAAGGGGVSYGGAMAIERGVTVLSNCVLVANHALGTTQSMLDPGSGSADGGAVFHAEGSLSITSTVLQQNTAVGGGGINRGGEPSEAGPANGGAVFNQSGNLEIRESTFVSNQAAGGAGYGSSLGFIYNGGQGRGGAIYNLGAMSAINCTLTDNRAKGGPQLGSTLSSGGSGYGGAILTSGGISYLLNVTVASNSVQFGAPRGGEALGSSIAVNNSGSLALTNTILLCAPAQTNVYGSVIDGGHNLSSDSSAVFSLASSMNNVDPLLSALAYQGGRTPTMALLPASPAIDRGDGMVSPKTDQRGVPRPKGFACDVGAFELAPMLTLTGPPGGMTRVGYLFVANKTNQFSVSTNLTDWTLLGTRVADAEGRTDLEEVNPVVLPSRFYRVRPGTE